MDKYLHWQGCDISIGVWDTKLLLVKRYNLKPNEYRKEKNGRQVLVSVDELSGEERIFICNGSPEEEIHFESEIDIANKSSKVIKNVDIKHICMLDETKYI